MTDKKINSRASQTKVKEQKKVWTPPSSLDAPPAPDGFKHRWIRAESMGFDDSSNMSAKLRSGFELVRADEYSDVDYPSYKTGNTKELSELAAFCWQGYRKKLLSRAKSILQNKLKNEMTR